MEYQEVVIRKWVPNYEGRYFATSDGKVFSLVKRDGSVSPVPHQLGVNANPNGYHPCHLSKKGTKTWQTYVHVVVAITFGLPNDDPNRKTEINHKDENKSNNCVYFNADGSLDLERTNLEWVTSSQNKLHGTYRQRMVSTRWGRNYMIGTRQNPNYNKEYYSRVFADGKGSYKLYGTVDHYTKEKKDEWTDVLDKTLCRFVHAVRDTLKRIDEEKRKSATAEERRMLVRERDRCRNHSMMTNGVDVISYGALENRIRKGKACRSDWQKVNSALYTPPTIDVVYLHSSYSEITNQSYV